MNRRSFLTKLAGLGAPAMVAPKFAEAALPKAKITRVRIYKPQDFNPTFNQSNMVVTVETDIGLTGIGEGGSKDMLEQCAGTLIGQDPFRSEMLWGQMFKGWFYPPGREKMHAQGALDLALWDLKGKAFQAPVHQLLGGMMRNHWSATGRAAAGDGGDAGPAHDDAGPREGDDRLGLSGLPDIGGDGAGGRTYNTRQQVSGDGAAGQGSARGRGAGGRLGDRLSPAVRLQRRAAGVQGDRGVRALLRRGSGGGRAGADRKSPKLRKMTTVPLTHGEEWGRRWDFYPLVENKDVDYIRATVPNVGGITEMQKIAALCQTHAVGICPHFTGPIATAAIVHVLGPFSGPVLVEIGSNTRLQGHLKEGLDFREGKCWPNDRPGLGVTLDMTKLTQIGEVTAAGNKLFYFRPDGSLTHW